MFSAGIKIVLPAGKHEPGILSGPGEAFLLRRFNALLISELVIL